MIKLFLTDCDGCLTDGGMYYSENGDELKKFNTRDGQGIKNLQAAGIITGVITGEDVSLNERRCKKLGIEEYFPGAKNKLEIVNQLCMKYGLSLNQVSYVGDDVGDIEVLKVVGLSFAPLDGQPEAKEVAQIITNAKGGEGVIREASRIVIQKNKES